MVERCVRDAEVVGSNPVASTTHRKSETNWFSGFLFAILVVMQQQKGKEKLTDQERFMKEAIRQAKKAEALEEVPIGCVIVRDGKNLEQGRICDSLGMSVQSIAGQYCLKYNLK